MAKRKRIGLLFSYNENWIGGTYYLLNVINALNTLEDNLKPIVVIITKEKSNLELVKKETNYPYLKLLTYPIKLTKIERGINKLSRCFGKVVFDKNKIIAPIDVLYPDSFKLIKNRNLKKISWIPDFQEEYLPHFFSEQEIINRKKWQLNISKYNDIVVFSSYDAKNHFDKLYPKSSIQKIVLHFAVTLPDISALNKSEVLKKHQLPENYFFAPNQFWAHKNHSTILKAVQVLKEKGVNIFVAFSGKDHDYRNIEYVKSLRNYITENNLEKNISFLGFIDRKEQLLILKESIAVIQPSLFEGWSTVVEDSKALNKFILLSDLPVHKEQIKDNCELFERKNYLQLSRLLEKYNTIPPKNDNFNDYNENINKFGKEFIQLIDKAT